MVTLGETSFSKKASREVIIIDVKIPISSEHVLSSYEASYDESTPLIDSQRSVNVLNKCQNVLCSSSVVCMVAVAVFVVLAMAVRCMIGK